MEFRPQRHIRSKSRMTRPGDTELTIRVSSRQQVDSGIRGSRSMWPKEHGIGPHFLPQASARLPPLQIGWLLIYNSANFRPSSLNFARSHSSNQPRCVPRIKILEALRKATSIMNHLRCALLFDDPSKPQKRVLISHYILGGQTLSTPYVTCGIKPKISRGGAHQGWRKGS